MPVSSPASGEGLPSRSASAMGSGAVSGHHVLKIVGYSRTKVVPNCKSIQSRPFTVGGVTWHARYYPNGDTAEEADSISMHLVLADSVAGGVKAQVTISLLDQDRNPVPSYMTTQVLNFSDKGIGWYLKFIKRGVLEKSEYLLNDSFTVRFDLTVLKDVYKEETAFVVVPPPDMQRHFGHLLSSKEGVDVRFRVGAETFSAHRLVLAARSPVFKAELYGIMKESASTDIIPIDDMEAEVFSALLTFIYTDELPVMEEQEECVIAQHLLVAADRYFLERLKLICEDKLCKHIDKDSAPTILALAKKHNCHALKEACLEFIQSSANLDAVMETAGVEYLTRSCPRVLKQLTSKVVPRWLLGSKSKAHA
ncbi:hypothetical protein EJB05_22758, partial [Eragrostis curvula]